MRVVLDTNVIVSATLNSKGASAQIISLFKAHSFTLISSPPLLNELRAVLSRQRLAKYVIRGTRLRQFVTDLERSAVMVSPTETLRVIERDPPDNRVLEAAVEGSADYIVSGDTDLLELGSYRGIMIVAPARFAAILQVQAKR